MDNQNDQVDIKISSMDKDDLLKLLGNLREKFKNKEITFDENMNGGVYYDKQFGGEININDKQPTIDKINIIIEKLNQLKNQNNQNENENLNAALNAALNNLIDEKIAAFRVTITKINEINDENIARINNNNNLVSKIEELKNLSLDYINNIQYTRNSIDSLDNYYSIINLSELFGRPVDNNNNNNNNGQGDNNNNNNNNNGQGQQQPNGLNIAKKLYGLENNIINARENLKNNTNPDLKADLEEKLKVAEKAKFDFLQELNPELLKEDKDLYNTIFGNIYGPYKKIFLDNMRDELKKRNIQFKQYKDEEQQIEEYARKTRLNKAKMESIIQKQLTDALKPKSFFSFSRKSSPIILQSKDGTYEHIISPEKLNTIYEVLKIIGANTKSAKLESPSIDTIQKLIFLYAYPDILKQNDNAVKLVDELVKFIIFNKDKFTGETKSSGLGFIENILPSSPTKQDTKQDGNVVKIRKVGEYTYVPSENTVYTDINDFSVKSAWIVEPQYPSYKGGSLALTYFNNNGKRITDKDGDYSKDDAKNVITNDATTFIKYVLFTDYNQVNPTNIKLEINPLLLRELLKDINAVSIDHDNVPLNMMHVIDNTKNNTINYIKIYVTNYMNSLNKYIPNTPSYKKKYKDHISGYDSPLKELTNENENDYDNLMNNLIKLSELYGTYYSFDKFYTTAISLLDSMLNNNTSLQNDVKKIKDNINNYDIDYNQDLKKRTENLNNFIKSINDDIDKINKLGQSQSSASSTNIVATNVKPILKATCGKSNCTAIENELTDLKKKLGDISKLNDNNTDYIKRQDVIDKYKNNIDPKEVGDIDKLNDNNIKYIKRQDVIDKYKNYIGQNEVGDINKLNDSSIKYIKKEDVSNYKKDYINPNEVGDNGKYISIDKYKRLKEEKKQLEEDVSKVKESRTRCKEFENDNKELKTKNENLSKTNKEIKEKVEKAVEEAKKLVKDKEQKINELTKKADELSRQANAEKIIKDNLLQNMQNYERVKPEYERYTREIKPKLDQIKGTGMDIGTIYSEYMRLKPLADQYIQNKGEFDKYLQEIKPKLENMQKCEGNILAYRNKNNELEKTVEGLTKDVSKWEDEYDKLKEYQEKIDPEEINKLRYENKKLEKDNKYYINELKKNKDEMQKLLKNQYDNIQNRYVQEQSMEGMDENMKQERLNMIINEANEIRQVYTKSEPVEIVRPMDNIEVQKEGEESKEKGLFGKLINIINPEEKKEDEYLPVPVLYKMERKKPSSKKKSSKKKSSKKKSSKKKREDDCDKQPIIYIETTDKDGVSIKKKNIKFARDMAKKGKGLDEDCKKVKRIL